MNITVNNQPMTVPDACTVETLCALLGLSSIDGAAIAVGMDVLSPVDYPVRLLKEGDKITVIRATCGG